MNVQDIITRVRRSFGDEAAVQIQDADVIRWINDAQIEIVKNNDTALQKTTTMNLVAGQASYALPADLFLLRSLRYQFPDMSSFSALKYKNMQEFDESIDGWDGSLYNSGHPVYFTRFEGNAILFPTPDTSVTSGLKILYNQRPTDVALVADTPALDLIYHNTIFKYCMYQASLLDDNLEPASLYRGDFQQDMSSLKNREAKDSTSVYPTITVLSADQ